MLRLKYKSHDPLSRAAKRLTPIMKGIVPDDVTLHRKDTVAFVVGYNDWADLQKSGISPDFAPEELSKFDEECTPAELKRRREYQAARLIEVCARRGVVIEDLRALPLIQAWRPSAGRPQEDTETFVERERLLAAGEGQRCSRLLRDLVLNGDSPTDAEVASIIRGLELFSAYKADLSSTYIGPLAVNLVNMQTGDAARRGVRLLEALAARGFPYSRVSLAKALLNGWGTKEDPHRAWSLVTEALTADEEGERQYIEDQAYVELYMLAANLCMQGRGCPRDPLRALRLYEKAARLNDPDAARLAAMFYAELKEGEVADEFYGVVPPDPVKAEHYFEIVRRERLRRRFLSMTNAWLGG